MDAVRARIWKRLGLRRCRVRLSCTRLCEIESAQRTGQSGWKKSPPPCLLDVDGDAMLHAAARTNVEKKRIKSKIKPWPWFRNGDRLRADVCQTQACWGRAERFQGRTTHQRITRAHNRVPYPARAPSLYLAAPKAVSFGARRETEFVLVSEAQPGRDAILIPWARRGDNHPRFTAYYFSGESKTLPERLSTNPLYKQGLNFPKYLQPSGSRPKRFAYNPDFDTSLGEQLDEQRRKLRPVLPSR